MNFWGIFMLKNILRKYLANELGVRKLNPIGLGSMAADRPDELECCCQKEKQDQSGHYGCLCGRCMCIQLQLLYCCDSYEPWLSVTFY